MNFRMPDSMQSGALTFLNMIGATMKVAMLKPLLKIMSDALKACGRPIVLSICEWGEMSRGNGKR